MTVIAWDGRTLAADKRTTGPGGKVSVTTKIFHGRQDGELLATAGHAAVAQELRAWYLAGAEPEKFPASARGDVAELIVFSSAEVRCFDSGPYPHTIECAQVVAGAGGDVARGVMHMGGTAVQAVEAAILYRGDCGGGVDVLTLIG